MDVGAFVAHLQGLAVVAPAIAGVARHVDVREEMHFHLEYAIAFASLAPPALHIEREAPRSVATLARQGHAGEQFPDRCEQAGIRSRVGPRRAADRTLIDVDHLVEVIETVDALVRRRLVVAAVQMPGDRAIERVVDQRGLAGAGHAGDAHEKANRQIQVGLQEIVAARADQVQPLARLRSVSQVGHTDASGARQELPGGRLRGLHDFLRRASGDHFAAMASGTRTHVDHVVGAEDGIEVVFDDDDGVAQVTQPQQRLQQPVVVALVQADGRLVEHVHDTGQPGADLAGQPDALRLAAREGVGRSIERQVVEADVDQETEPRGDLPHQLVGDGLARAGEPQGREERGGVIQGEMTEFMDRPAADEHEARLAAQAGAFAFGAGRHGLIGGKLFPDRLRVGLPVAPLQIGDDALEHVLAHVAAPALADVGEPDLFVPGAVEHEITDALVQRHERGLDVEPVVGRQRFEHLVVELITPVPALHRAGRERQVRKGNHALRIEEGDATEAIAARAGATRAVEREQARFQVRQRIIAERAGVARRECAGRSRVHVDHDGASVRQAQRGLERFGEALLEVGAHLDPVDHDFDGVLAGLRQTGWRIEVDDLAVEPHAHESLCPQVVEHVHLGTLPVGNDRRQDHDPRFFRQCQDRIHHLRHGLRSQRHAVGRAVGLSDPREQQPQVVVDLGDGADGRARIVTRRLLLDGDRGRQPLDQIDVGLLHQLQELARVCRERLDVAPLAFGIQGVERQRRLARSR